MIAVAMFPLLLLCLFMAPIAGWIFSLLAAYTLLLGLVGSVCINSLPVQQESAA